MLFGPRVKDIVHRVVTLEYVTQIIMVATFAVEGKRYCVVGLHLKAKDDPGCEATRIRTVQAVRHLFEYRNRDLMPIIIMGDFNTEPDKRPVVMLTNDGFTSAHPDATPTTYKVRSTIKRRCIDFILVPEGMRVEEAATHPAAPHLDDPCGYPRADWFSDHFALSATLVHESA